jgi:hypothetical protein
VVMNMMRTFPQIGERPAGPHVSELRSTYQKLVDLCWGNESQAGWSGAFEETNWKSENGML